MSALDTSFAQALGIEVPLVCGAMYPCSNPELVAAVSAAGAVGVVQPISLTHVHGHDLREGLRLIRSLTDRPIGFNALIEKTVAAYERRMREWVDIALEEGVRYFVTALGNPRWVVDLAHQAGGLVYHDVTARKWAEKALDAGVDGLVCVNSAAGGHAGELTAEQLVDELGDMGLPLLCAGGVGDGEAFARALSLGYAGVQCGTRFIATQECKVHEDYTAALLASGAEDVVLTDKLSGTPCAVLRTPELERAGLLAGPLARRLLRGRHTKHWMRAWYALRSVRSLRKASIEGVSYRDVFQAGKSVEAVNDVPSAAEIVERFAAAAGAHSAGSQP